jgi:hypothetical protein
MTTRDLLENWIYSKNRNKVNGREIARELARENWTEFGEAVIKRALNNSNCVSYQQFRANCKFYDSVKKV